MTILDAKRFPTQQSFILASSIKAVADAFIAAKAKYQMIEAFPSLQDYVGVWTKDENSELAKSAVDVDKKYTQEFSYLSFDTAGLKYLADVVANEVQLPEGVTVEILMPKRAGYLICVVLNF